MVLKSELEWESDYQHHRFSFKEWGNFINFFRLDPEMKVTVPARGFDEDGNPAKERTIRLCDLPKHKSGATSIKLAVQTQNKLVKFEAVGKDFQAKKE